MRSSIALVARFQTVTPEVSVISVDVDSLVGKRAVKSNFIRSVHVLSLQEKLSSLHPVLVNLVCSVGVDHWDCINSVPLEDLNSLWVLVDQSMKDVEDGVEWHLDTDELS